MVKSHALPDTESATASPIYRHPNAKDQLVHTPLDGIATVYDLITKRGFSGKPEKEILGERKLVRMIEEEKEVTKKVPGGGEVKEVKTWKYYQLSGYDWMTWRQVEALSTAYASGYRALGLNAGDKLTIYADTSRDWLVTAIACIQQSITITTAYATLGEEGLTYSLQECEISTVFTNAELLPMLTKVAHVVKYLKNIVYNGDADAQALVKLKKDHPRLKVLLLGELRTLGMDSR
ncbi:long-chain fatty acid-CoA ligase [Chytriomyces hyalinus]|nr:long-chain fatty acid-CoA ligase [Chytriomyces hyalinus]